MYKIFISHSVRDSNEVREFINLLVLGMNIPKEEIFSVLLCDSLPTGEAFSEKIKQEMLAAEKIICFITPNYLESKFCLAELGAAWIQNKKLVPILFSPLDYGSLNNTPLIGMQACFGDKKADLTALHDEFLNGGIVKTANTSELNRCLDIYLASLKREPLLIEKDDDGFYTAKIERVRGVPQNFKCYKIRGLLKLNEAPVEGETHWIFYRTGMYRELKPGDTVRLKVGRTEMRQFRDLPNARNIYPDSLEAL